MQTSWLCTLQQKAQLTLSTSSVASNNAVPASSSSCRGGCKDQGPNSSSSSSFRPRHSSSTGSRASFGLTVANGYRQSSALDSSEDPGVSVGPGQHSKQHKKAKQQRQWGHPSDCHTGSLDETSGAGLGMQRQVPTAAAGVRGRNKQRRTRPGNGHSSAPGSQTGKAGQQPGKGRAAATAPIHHGTEQTSSRPWQAVSASSNAGRASSPAASFPLSTLKSPFFNVRLKSFQQLQHLVRVHGFSARIADITAMMSRLKYVNSPSAADKAALLQDMWHLLARQLRYAAPRHCAEAMLTSSKLGSCPKGLYEACIQQTVLQIETAEARILANAIYAVAIAPSESVPPTSLQQVWDVLLPAFMRVLPDDNSQSIANVAYALAVLSSSSSSDGVSGGSSDGCAREHLQALLQAAKPSLWADASSQETSNTLWAAGTLGAEMRPELLQLLLARVVAAAEQASAQDITNSVYGVTLLQQQQLLQPQQHEVLTCALLQKQPDAQAISGFLWSTAKMGLQLQQQQVDSFIGQLMLCGEQLVPQAISLSLWGVANLERSIRPAALLQLLQRLAAAAPAPQALGLSLWAAAKLRAEVPAALLDQLYQQLASVAEQAEPQSLSNALWAASVMLPQPYLPTALIGDEAQQHQGQQKPQQTQKSPVPGGRKRAKQRQQQQQALAAFVAKVAGMKPLELSNVALALALLGFKQMDILQPVYQAALRHLDGPPSSPAAGSRGTGSSSSWGEGDGSAFVLGPQALSNLSWAGAILDLREHQQQLRRLAQACVASWGCGQDSGPAEEAVQLYQVHLWLTELVGTEGLEGVLTPEQLLRCRDSLRSSVSAPSVMQGHVYQAALSVPGLQDVQLEAVTEDGLLTVDIAAVLAAGQGEEGAVSCDAATSASSSGNPSSGAAGNPSSGAAGASSSSAPMQSECQRVAIEVDGPWHWRRADMRPTGPSAFRNRLLAHRGYTVVTVPYFEWQGLKDHERAAYLQQAIQQQRS